MSDKVLWSVAVVVAAYVGLTLFLKTNKLTWNQFFQGCPTAGGGADAFDAGGASVPCIEKGAVNWGDNITLRAVGGKDTSGNSWPCGFLYVQNSGDCSAGATDRTYVLVDNTGATDPSTLGLGGQFTMKSTASASGSVQLDPTGQSYTAGMQLASVGAPTGCTPAGTYNFLSRVGKWSVLQTPLTSMYMYRISNSSWASCPDKTTPADNTLRYGDFVAIYDLTTTQTLAISSSQLPGGAAYYGEWQSKTWTGAASAAYTEPYSVFQILADDGSIPMGTPKYKCGSTAGCIPCAAGDGPDTCCYYDKQCSIVQPGSACEKAGACPQKFKCLASGGKYTCPACTSADQAAGTPCFPQSECATTCTAPAGCPAGASVFSFTGKCIPHSVRGIIYAVAIAVAAYLFWVWT
jgi:hypothetical protein